MAKLFLSTSCFPHSKVADAIIECGKYGIYNIEISAPHQYQPYIEIANDVVALKKEGYDYIVHNYSPPPNDNFVLNIASTKSSDIARNNEFCNNVFEFAKMINSPLYGIHAGYLSQAVARENGIFDFEKQSASPKDALIAATDFASPMVAKFKQKKIEFIIENLFPNLDVQNSLCCTLDEIKMYMNRMPKYTKLLLDLGHMNISSNLLKFDKWRFLRDYLSEFGNRLLEVHLSDNDGVSDQHNALTKDSWQLEAIKIIESYNLQSGMDRIYTIESRNATKSELQHSVDLVRNVLSR